MAFLHLLVGLLATASTWACDVGYDFGDHTDALATKLKISLTWWTVEPQNKANVYMSTALGTGCNSGYFGAQFHSNENETKGWQTLLFSMWDAPHHVGFTNNSKFPYQAIPVSGNCWRNALDSKGKSTGVQCGQPWPKNPNASVDVGLRFGVPYEFTMEMTAQNKSGAMWEMTVFDPANVINISLGKIFFVDAPLGLPSTCRAFGQVQDPPKTGLSSYTFLEYFDDAPFVESYDYTTRATWSGMTFYSPNNTEYPVKDIVKDCCGHTYLSQDTNKSYYDTSSRCLPPECDSLELNMECGPYKRPSRAAFVANPGCETPSKRLGSSLGKCWQEGSPTSLDHCFGNAKYTV